jgi:hypothetical protein
MCAVAVAGATGPGSESTGQGWKFGNCDANGLKWGIGSGISEIWIRLVLSDMD